MEDEGQKFESKIEIQREYDEENEEEIHILYIQLVDEDKYGNETEYWVNLEELVKLGIAKKNVRNF